MNKWLWYFCVLVAGVLLIIGVIAKNTFYIALAFVLALLLKGYTKSIPRPKSYDKIQEKNAEAYERKLEKEALKSEKKNKK